MPAAECQRDATGALMGAVCRMQSAGEVPQERSCFLKGGVVALVSRVQKEIASS